MTSFIDEWPTHLSLTRWRFFIRGPEARDKEYTTLVQIMTVNLLTRVQERRTPLYSLASFSVCCRHVQRMCYNLFIVLSIKSINFRYGNNVPVRIEESFNIKLKSHLYFIIYWPVYLWNVSALIQIKMYFDLQIMNIPLVSLWQYGII